MRVRLLVASYAAVGLSVAVAGCGSGSTWHQPLLSSCQVEAAGGNAILNPDQMANAATISAVAERRQLPDRAVVVALATALQESKLENDASGDHDSVGLFQQRPSQGWGSPDQLSNPRYAAGKFYDKLLTVSGWQDMRVTDAAQAVQNSAYPEEYQKWAAESETLADALVGAAGGTLTCDLHDGPAKRGTAALQQLTADFRLDWGSSVRTEDTDGRLLVPTDGQRSGWQFAHWIVAHADTTGVESVQYGSRRWSVQSSTWKTVHSEGTAGSPPPVVVTVYATK